MVVVLFFSLHLFVIFDMLWFAACQNNWMDLIALSAC